MRMFFLFLAFFSIAFSQQQRPPWLSSPGTSPVVVSPFPAAPVARPRPAPVVAPKDSRVDSLLSKMKTLSSRLDSLDSAFNAPVKIDTVQRKWHVVWTVANADTLHGMGINGVHNYPRKYSDLLDILSDTKQAGYSVYEFAVALTNFDTLRYVMGGTSSRSTGNIISGNGGNYEGKIEYYNTGLTMYIYPSGRASIEYISTDLAQTTLRLSAHKEGNCINASTQFLSTETTRILWILWTVHRQQVKHLWLSACYEDLIVEPGEKK